MGKKYLHVYDLGSYVHGGLVNKYCYFEGSVVGSATEGWSCQTLEAGPVSLVFQSIKQYKDDSDFIFCSDRTPTVKQIMYTGYKASRSHSPEIERAKRTLEMCLEYCGYDVYYDDGYEADDFVYDVVRKLSSKYEHVYVHTGDADLYCLVSKKVSIAKTLTNTKEVNLYNYSEMCERNNYILYNTVTIRKILYGCRSDEIPGLNSQEAKLVTTWINMNEKYAPLFGDRDYIMGTLARLTPAIGKQCELVFPLPVETRDTVAAGDYDKVVVLGQLAHVNKFKHERSSESERLKAEGFVLDMCEKLYKDII